jgi:hypothetical protein
MTHPKLADRDHQGKPMTKVRTAHDATDDERLRRNPSDEDAKLDVALDETFPTSDPPSNTQPGKGKDPAPSSSPRPDFGMVPASPQLCDERT